QTVPISTSDEIELTPSDLPHASPLLLYSAFIISDFYFSNNDLGIESLMLSKKLYNSITRNKNIESEVIISYFNQNGHYDALKNNLKKPVLFIIRRLKVGTKKMLHLIASDIEWNYTSNEQSSETSNKEKRKAQNDINNHLDTIKEKYAKLSISPSRKRKQSNLLTTSFSFKTQKASPETKSNFLNTVSQIKNTDP
ncbi:21978_t:CDS:1, partial [Racocetra persica]